jgi:hypothetical protein
MSSEGNDEIYHTPETAEGDPYQEVSAYINKLVERYTTLVNQERLEYRGAMHKIQNPQHHALRPIARLAELHELQTLLAKKQYAQVSENLEKLSTSYTESLIERQKQVMPKSNDPEKETMQGDKLYTFLEFEIPRLRRQSANPADSPYTKETLQETIRNYETLRDKTQRGFLMQQINGYHQVVQLYKGIEARLPHTKKE